MMRYKNLEDAVINSDSLAEAVKYVIESQNPDERFSDLSGGEITLLHYMVMAKLDAGVSVMLEIGADPNVRSSDGTPPLITAVMLKSYDIVRQLVKAGAEVNIQELDYGDTPLHLALFNNCPEIALYLLSRGANPDGYNYFGMTPKKMEYFEKMVQSAELSHNPGIDNWENGVPDTSSEKTMVSFLLLSQMELSHKTQPGSEFQVEAEKVAL